MDANKRTALDTVATFYFLNGYRLSYDDEVRSVLKRLATDERSVDRGTTIAYLAEHAAPTDTERVLREFQDDLVEFGLDRYEEYDASE